MSSSRILRDPQVTCQCVVMTDLSEVSAAKSGSFTVAECPAQARIPSHVLNEGGAEPEGVPQPQIDEEAIRQQGFDEGRQAGLDEAESRLGNATKALAEACRQLSTQRQKQLEGSRDDMLRMVLAIAERVVMVELSAHKEAITQTVQQAIQAAVSAEEFHIKVNPADLEIVQQHKPLFIASLTGLTNIEFVTDPGVTAGGCVLESSVGRVDATIEAQMEEIAQTLKEAIGGE